MNSNNKNNELPEFHDKVNSKTGFKVPEGYFEEFSDKMVSALGNELDREIPQISIWKRINSWMSSYDISPKMVVSFASLLLVLTLGYNYFSVPAEQELLAMNEDEAMEYILDHSDEMDIEDLYTMELGEINLVDITIEDSELYLDEILDEIDEEMLEEMIL